MVSGAQRPQVFAAGLPHAMHNNCTYSFESFETFKRIDSFGSFENIGMIDDTLSFSFRLLQFFELNLRPAAASGKNRQICFYAVYGRGARGARGGLKTILRRILSTTAGSTSQSTFSC